MVKMGSVLQAEPSKKGQEPMGAARPDKPFAIAVTRSIAEDLIEVGIQTASTPGRLGDLQCSLSKMMLTASRNIFNRP